MSPKTRLLNTAGSSAVLDDVGSVWASIPFQVDFLQPPFIDATHSPRLVGDDIVQGRVEQAIFEFIRQRVLRFKDRAFVRNIGKRRSKNKKESRSGSPM
jgi:hypothetical protein